VSDHRGKFFSIVTDSSDGRPTLQEMHFEHAPPHIAEFLTDRKWRVVSQGPNYQLWHNDQESWLQYTWEQAMAIEFYHFIRLGRD
jgi:hypothetical protein